MHLNLNCGKCLDESILKARELLSLNSNPSYIQDLYGGWFPKFSAEDREKIKIEIEIDFDFGKKIEVNKVKENQWEFEVEGKRFVIMHENNFLSFHNWGEFHGHISMEYYPMTIQDDGVYSFDCSNNHKNTFLTRSPKYEILFLMGENAFLDSYYREAVSNFAASLERFYEFFIRFCAFKNGISEEIFEETWKDIAKQSERQRGAFVYAWLQEKRESPTMLSNSKQNFRNEVIHQGKIPVSEKVIEFGQEVITVIHPAKSYIESLPDNILGKYLSFEASRTTKKVGKQISTQMSFDSAISAFSKREESLKKHLENMKLYRKFSLVQ